MCFNLKCMEINIYFILFMTQNIQARFGRSVGSIGGQSGRQWGHPVYMMTHNQEMTGNEYSETEDFNTQLRNTPGMEFTERKPELMLDPLAAMFMIQSLALKELQNNESPVAVSRPSLPWNESTLRKAGVYILPMSGK